MLGQTGHEQTGELYNFFQHLNLLITQAATKQTNAMLVTCKTMESISSMAQKVIIYCIMPKTLNHQTFMGIK